LLFETLFACVAHKITKFAKVATLPYNIPMGKISINGKVSMSNLMMWA